MAIKFTIAKRGLLPGEEAALGAAKSGDGQADERLLRSLRPQVVHRQTVDAVAFQSGSSRLSSAIPRGELVAALSVLQDVIVHELEKGNAVTLPYIGTFRLALKGGIEVEQGSYHGRDVRVDGLVFRPDAELLQKVRSIEVDQAPFGQVFHVGNAEAEAQLTELFARQSTVTTKDVVAAFGQTLSRGRAVGLLRRLAGEGRLVREGKGSQTRYRAAEGQFGR